MEALKKEGEAGSRKINQYTRYFTVALATFQALGIAVALESQAGLFFFFNVAAPTEIYTLSLHDALPISLQALRNGRGHRRAPAAQTADGRHIVSTDRKSTRLNSSHANISYAVFCLK